MKILLLKLKHIGDTLILTPTIHAIRQNYPDAIIDVVVRKGCESVLEGNEEINEIYTVAAPERDKRSGWEEIRGFWKTLKTFTLRRYDYAFDLSDSDRAKMIILLTTSKKRGINIRYSKLGWKRGLFNSVSEYDWAKNHQVYKDFQTVKDILKFPGNPGLMSINTENIDPDILSRYRLEKQKYVVIHPVSRWTFKEWDPKKWKEIISTLNRKGWRVLLSSGPAADEIGRIYEIIDDTMDATATEGKTSLRELAYIIRNASLFIGVDTAAMHIAAAVETPVIALMGASNPVAWGPWSEENVKTPYQILDGIQHIGKHTVISRKSSEIFYENGSKKSSGMQDISVEEVVKALNEYI